jgi:hypothetical protein
VEQDERGTTGTVAVELVGESQALVVEVVVHGVRPREILPTEADIEYVRE